MAASACLAVLLTACGPDAPAAAPTPLPAPIGATVPPTAAPEPVAAEVVALPLPATVELREADLEVSPPADSAADSALSAMTVEGVRTLTAVRSFGGTLVTLDGDRTVSIAAVDPDAFRPFTPEVTAQAAPVWERLHAGDALLRHDVAHDLGIDLGGTVLLLSEAGAVEVRIGAFASNGAPPIADIIVPWAVGERLGQEAVTLLLVDVDDDHNAKSVGDDVVSALGGGEARRRRAPSSQEAQLFSSQGAVRIAPFSYTSVGDGTIVIDPAWVRDWIVRVDLPRLGRAYVNKAMAPQLLAAFHELEAKGLLEGLDPGQFAGGWVARHIDWNPRKALSMHAWGLAVDINSRDNALGATPTMDPRVVEVFDRWGFSWGGRWSRPDGMHFELAKIVTPA